MQDSKKLTPRMMREAIHTPAVQEALKTLSKYGLGVWLPHMHAEDGHLVPLPNEMVSIEVEGEEPATRQVTFVKRDTLDSSILNQTAVAWIWNESLNVAVVATSCTDENSRHD
jgi:hypothetical protein